MNLGSRWDGVVTGVARCSAWEIMGRARPHAALASCLFAPTCRLNTEGMGLCVVARRAKEPELDVGAVISLGTHCLTLAIGKEPLSLLL